MAAARMVGGVAAQAALVRMVAVLRILRGTVRGMRDVRLRVTMAKQDR